MNRDRSAEGLTERDLLVRVHQLLQDLSTKVEGLLTKVVLAVAALAGASLGLKFVGSPFLTVLGLYVGWFGLFFLPLSLVVWWKKLAWERRVTRALFTLFLTVSVSSRTFLFHAGEQPAPWWYPPTIDLLLGSVVAAMIVTVWREK